MPVLSGSQINMLYGYYMDKDDVRHCVTGSRDSGAEHGVRWHSFALCSTDARDARYLSTAVRPVTCIRCVAFILGREQVLASVR